MNLLIFTYLQMHFAMSLNDFRETIQIFIQDSKRNPNNH